MSPSLGDRLPLEVSPAPGPRALRQPWSALGSPPLAPGGRSGSQAPGVLWGVPFPVQTLIPGPTLARGRGAVPGPFSSGAQADHSCAEGAFPILLGKVQPPRPSCTQVYLLAGQPLGAQSPGPTGSPGAQTTPGPADPVPSDPLLAGALGPHWSPPASELLPGPQEPRGSSQAQSSEMSCTI